MKKKFKHKKEKKIKEIPSVKEETEKKEIGEFTRFKYPYQIFLIALILSILKGLPALTPFIFTLTPKNEKENIVYLPIGYIPKDWFQYTSLIHQCAYSNSFFLYNPFTTEKQEGRFILLFHRFLGFIHSISGANVFWLLELSRVPLLFLFIMVLWKFLCKILKEPNHCLWAIWLIAFSGGLEFFLIMAMPKLNLPQNVSDEIYQQLWPLYGWNSFEAFYNPLWLAALILLIIIIEPLLKETNSFTTKNFIIISLGIIVLWFVHPYTAFAVFSIFCTYLALSIIFQNKISWIRISKRGISLMLGIIIIGLITFWQKQDLVFKKTSSSFFGAQNVSLFWYPLTYGLLILFFLLGLKKMIRENHPWLFPMIGWTTAIVILHNSPILNGYKFLMYLHMPICIVAAPAVADWFKNQKKNLIGYCRSGIVIILIFISTIFISIESIKEVRAYGIPESWLSIAKKMKELPPGNILAPMPLSNILPSFTHHKVYNGHWFMTPDSNLKSKFYLTIMQNPLKYSYEINNLIEKENINYIIQPINYAEDLKLVIKNRIKFTIPIDDWIIIILH